MATADDRWRALIQLKNELVFNENLHKRNNPQPQRDQDNIPDAAKRLTIIASIEHTILQITEDMSRGLIPKLNYAVSAKWKTVTFVENEGVVIDIHTTSGMDFGVPRSIRNFAMTMAILSQIMILLQTETTRTKRDIYYQDTNLYKSQQKVDRIVGNISRTLKVPRRFLNIVATNKGLVYGALSFVESNGNFIDCSAIRTGVSVPEDADNIYEIVSDAELIIVIEKDATFQRLSGDLDNLPPHILITGKGYPDLRTRQLIKKLWNILHIPIFALVDADPHGIEIMFTYRFGSLMCYDGASLSVPAIRWLGVLPSDIHRLNIATTVALEPLTGDDVKKLNDLKCRPYCDAQSRDTESASTAQPLPQSDVLAQ